MSMDIVLIVKMAVVLCLGAAIHSTVGFAYAIFAVPIIVWMGVSLPHAIVIVSTCSFVQNLISMIQLRREVPWRQVGSACLTGYMAIIAGILILGKISRLSTENIKIILGAVIIILTIIQITIRIQPREKLHWLWGFSAFFASGFMQGVCGMGAPPLVMWLLAHNWSVAKTRSFLFAIFVCFIPVQLFILYLTLGNETLTGIAQGIIFTPVVFLGTAIGLAIGNRMAKPVLCKIVYIVLFIIGFSSILPLVIK